MKAKWFFSALIIILAISGICREKITVPNQEIVLQFTGDDIASSELQDVVKNITERLQTVGITAVEVNAVPVNGTLKIKYYSVTDITRIKKILSSENILDYNYTSQDNKTKLPFEDNLNRYNLEVYEIQDINNLVSNVDGSFVLESKQEHDRFSSSPNVFLYIAITATRENNQLVNIAYKLNRAIAITIDNTSHKIPEVRAGPSV